MSNSHVDWAAAIIKAGEANGEWILIASDVPKHTVRVVKERKNMALREAGRMDARMLETYGNPPRGDLWMRSVTNWKPPRIVGDSQFRTVLVPLTLKQRLFERADKLDASVSSLVDVALVRINKRGRFQGDVEGSVLGVNVSTAKWRRALARAQRDGFVLADALRDELWHEVRKH